MPTQGENKIKLISIKTKGYFDCLCRDELRPDFWRKNFLISGNRPPYMGISGKKVIGRSKLF